MKSGWSSIVKAAGAIVLCILLDGCAPAEVTVPDTYTPPPQEPRSSIPLWLESPPPDKICGVYIQDIRDLRLDEQRNLGGISGVPVYGVDMVKWVKSGFLTLDNQGYHVINAVDNRPVPRHDVEIKVDLIKAYIETIYLDKSATMVMRVFYINAEHSRPVVRIYRGVDTSLNWAGSAAEVDGAFQRATKHILDQVRVDLKSYCPA